MEELKQFFNKLIKNWPHDIKELPRCDFLTDQLDIIRKINEILNKKTSKVKSLQLVGFKIELEDNELQYKLETLKRELLSIDTALKDEQNEYIGDLDKPEIDKIKLCINLIENIIKYF